MKSINHMCEQYGIALCYLFGSQIKQGLACLKGEKIDVEDAESDIDFAVSFISTPENVVETYAKLSVELGELVFPFQADLVFLHEVDQLIQLEAIQDTNIFAVDGTTKDSYELKIMAFAGDETVIFKNNEKDFL